MNYCLKTAPGKWFIGKTTLILTVYNYKSTFFQQKQDDILRVICQLIKICQQHQGPMPFMIQKYI